MKSIRCPNCQREIEWSERWPQRPFCSERCRLIDLGAWASEEHRIAGKENMPAEATGDSNEPEWVN